MRDGFYHFCCNVVRGSLPLLAPVSCFNMPAPEAIEGGWLIASNHQSFLDPALIAITLPRPIHFLARSSLLAIPGFGHLIRALSTHPVKRGTVDTQALKTIIRVLRGGNALLMFPEGTRSSDGEFGQFKPGAAAVAIRCSVPVLPACIEGAYDCWPRTRKLPRPARVGVAYGSPLHPGGTNAEELTRRLRTSMEELREGLRERLRE
jgi:1-acyl-sn-glycerol-3-phosphate acyltransferase